MRIVTILGFSLATACASFPPPNDTLANSVASARGAEEIGAKQVPKAALSLQLAYEAISKTKAMMERGDNERAHYMALRAHNDAEMALALTREAHAKQAALAAKADATAAANDSP